MIAPGPQNIPKGTGRVFIGLDLIHIYTPYTTKNISVNTNEINIPAIPKNMDVQTITFMSPAPNDPVL
jgi:hypothetical protein